MGIGDIAEDLVRGVGQAGDTLTGGLLTDPVIRLGVTGLARAGKTVFITSLVANLMNRARMGQLSAQAQGRIRSAYLQPQPDDTVPRFDYESHLSALTGPAPHWPESTRTVSQLRLSFLVQRGGLLGTMSGQRKLHLDIVDYPGEWLLDLLLLDQSYRDWSAAALSRAETRPGGAGFLQAAGAADRAASFDEPDARALTKAYTAYLTEARDAGYSDCTPGRFLLPGELEGSPALTFAPLPRPGQLPRGSLWREMERRFEAYKRQVVKPFFRDHFARIDRQVVLMDVLNAIHNGPRAVEDLRQAMAGILGAFRPGRNAWLTRLLGGRRVERILFAATKADHLHHSQHGQLSAIADAMLRDARDRADFAGAGTAALAIAALRATVEETRHHDGVELDLVRGLSLETGKPTAYYPGALPQDPAHILGPARAGDAGWLTADYGRMRFAPPVLTLAPGEGPPHIRLDKAAEFLIGDRL